MHWNLPELPLSSRDCQRDSLGHADGADLCYLRAPAFHEAVRSSDVYGVKDSLGGAWQTRFVPICDK